MLKTPAIEKSVEKTVSIKEKVAFLKQPGTYFPPPSEVEAIETHMSWVFIAGDIAYKLKKPVVYHFLDLRTLETRWKNCKEEIRLNRRLAPDIYIGIVPIISDKEGKLHIKGEGKIVEWLVKMKRIPRENLLDYAIKHHTANKTGLKKAAELLAGFYKNAQPVHLDPGSYRKKLKDEIEFAFGELSKPLYHFPSALIKALHAYLLRFVDCHVMLFDDRVAKGKIIEAHGDLKPEHISLAPEPAIIDALEFNRDLRIMDIAEELSFLSIECEVMGDFSAGALFMDVYSKRSQDKIPASLVDFYKIKKACLRTYLVARHIRETRYKNDPRWMTRANAYLRLAENYYLQSAPLDS